MSKPTPAVWAATKKRDGGRCVSCSTTRNLQFQHRKSTGAGGSKIRPTVAEGMTSCANCNPRYESDMQAKAIENGWKVRFKRENCPLVPVFYPDDLAWFKYVGVDRIQITVREAQQMFDDVYGSERQFSGA